MKLIIHKYRIALINFLIVKATVTTEFVVKEAKNCSDGRNDRIHHQGKAIIKTIGMSKIAIKGID